MTRKKTETLAAKQKAPTDDTCEGDPQQPVVKMLMTDEYFEYVKKYQGMYGPDTVVLLQNGSFFEMYGVDNDREQCFAEIREICDTLDIAVTRKSKAIAENSRTNPLMAGFPVWSYQKHIACLLEHGYTVVVFEQRDVGGRFERTLSEVLSPAVQLDYQRERDATSLVCVYVCAGEHYFTRAATWTASVCVMDITTGRTHMYDIAHAAHAAPESIFFDVVRVLRVHPPSECVVVLHGPFDTTAAYWQRVFEMPRGAAVHVYVTGTGNVGSDAKSVGLLFDTDFTTVQRLRYQRDFFARVLDIGSGVADVLDVIDVSRSDTMRFALMCLYQFVWNHNKNLMHGVGMPEWCERIETGTECVRIEHNALDQLNVFDAGGVRRRVRGARRVVRCVLDAVDATQTAAGHRFLRAALSKPLRDAAAIRARHADIARAIGIGAEWAAGVFAQMCDVERVQRKMQLNVIQLSELHALYTTYGALRDFLQRWAMYTVDKDTNTDVGVISAEDATAQAHTLDVACATFARTFDASALCTQNRTDIRGRVFCEGVAPDIDAALDAIERCDTDIERELEEFESLLQVACRGAIATDRCAPRAAVGAIATDRCAPRAAVGAIATDRSTRLERCERDASHCFAITPARYKKLIAHLRAGGVDASAEWDVRTQASVVKITTPSLKRASAARRTHEAHMAELTRARITEWVHSTACTHATHFPKWSHSVAYLDFIVSGALVAQRHKYVRPDIVDNAERAHVKCTALRHPLVERVLVDTAYIPNDVGLGVAENDTTHTDGYLVYGTNACGKSVYMKSVGLAVILAQAGYYVPCDHMVLSPYANVLTRMSGQDDPVRGHSSFAVEMIELNLVLQRAGAYSLVLGDEICHGTEHVSGVALMAATVLHLAARRASFVLATHLHQLSSMREITELPNVRLKHLSVRRDAVAGTLVYERALRDGSGDATYGIEVAKFVIRDTEFIMCAQRLAAAAETPKHSSRYNTQKRVGACEVCGDRATQTHHIVEQHTADATGHVRASSRSAPLPLHHCANLVALCETCHLAVHGKKPGARGRASKGTRTLVIRGYDHTAAGPQLQYAWEHPGDSV